MEIDAQLKLGPELKPLGAAGANNLPHLQLPDVYDKQVAQHGIKNISSAHS